MHKKRHSCKGSLIRLQKTAKPSFRTGLGEAHIRDTESSFYISYAYVKHLR